MGISKRRELEIMIEGKKEQIKALKLEIIELVKETYLLSDNEQWFEEKEEEHVVSKRPKRTEKFLIGRIHWNEDFKDEDTGEIITINRNQIVRKNGVWLL